MSKRISRIALKIQPWQESPRKNETASRNLDANITAPVVLLACCHISVSCGLIPTTENSFLQDVALLTHFLHSPQMFNSVSDAANELLHIESGERGWLQISQTFRTVLIRIRYQR